MENFKSFGRKISVPFLQGYTSITGPNGSGKSNIADAILFVLGPKSSKAIRAGKLTDLIWNGGKDKKPADSCQVSLLFDNSDRQIKQLEVDRDGALKFKDLNGRLTTAKAQLAYKNRELIERQIVGTKEQITKHEADKAKLEGQKAELRNLLDAAVARLSALEQEMADRGGEEAKQLKEKLDGLRIQRARAADGIETSKEALKQIRVDTGDANKERAKVQRETDALARERTNVDGRVGELDGQIKSADQDLHEVDELASKSDAKVLGIQKQIIALNNEIDQVEEKLKGIVLEGDRTKEAMARLESEISQIGESRKQ